MFLAVIRKCSIISILSCEEPLTSEETSFSCCSGHLVSGKNLRLCSVESESLHIFIKVHPLFIKKCVKCVMLTGSGFTQHQLEHSQLSLCWCVTVGEAEGLKGTAQKFYVNTTHFTFSRKVECSLTFSHKKKVLMRSSGWLDGVQKDLRMHGLYF